MVGLIVAGTGPAARSRRVLSVLPGRMALFVPAIFLLSGLAPAVLAAEPLQWKFKNGETLRYTMVQETSQGMKAGGQSLKTSINQTVDMHWSIKTVSSEGVADMTQTIDRVRLKVEGPGSAFEFDSTNGKAPEGPIAGVLLPLLKALVGAEFSLKMNSKGELSDVRVPQSLLDSLKQANPAAAGGGMFSEEGLKNLISSSSLSLPEGPLDKGKSWENQSRLPIPMIGTMVMDKHYTYQGPTSPGANQAQITLVTKVKIEPAADSNVAVKINSHDGKGEFAFDALAGRMLKSRVNDKMEMSLSIMGQDLEQSTETVTTMTLGEPGAAK